MPWQFQGRPSSSLLFLKKEKWDGYERSEYQGKRRRGAATAVPLRSTAALFGSSPGILSKTSGPAPAAGIRTQIAVRSRKLYVRPEKDSRPFSAMTRPPRNVAAASAAGEETGSRIEVVRDLEGVRGADAIYTDVWASMGQESEAEARKKIFEDYRIDGETTAAMGVATRRG